MSSKINTHFVFANIITKKNRGDDMFMIYDRNSQKAQKAKVQKSFSMALSTLMRETETTQAALADYLGITRQSVSQYMVGKTIPDIYILKQIAKYFNVTYEYLLGETQSKQKENIEINQKIGFNDKVINALVNVTKQTGVGYNVINDFLDDIGTFGFACDISKIRTLIKNTMNDMQKAHQSSPNGAGLRNYTKAIYEENAASNQTLTTNNVTVPSTEYIEFLISKVENKIMNAVEKITNYSDLKELERDLCYFTFVPAQANYLKGEDKDDC